MGVTEPDALPIGITPWRDDWDGTADSLAEQGELADRLGFHSFWLPESHFSGRMSNPAPLLRLAAVASRTKRLRLATTSYLLPLRHPLHVAAEVAVLDRLSEGRVILGVGRGFRRATFTAFEVSRKDKRDIFEASVAAITAAWSGEPVAWDEGPDSEDATPVRLAPLPLQKPHPPIWVAAFGPKAVALAGKLGLPYLASPIEPLETLQANYALHAEALDEAGRDRAIPVPVMRTVFVSDDPGTLARVHEALTRQAGALARAGTASLRRAAGAAVDDIAIVGEPEAVADRIRHYRESLGVTHLIARTHVPGVEPQELERSLHRLAALELRV